MIGPILPWWVCFRTVGVEINGRAVPLEKSSVIETDGQRGRVVYLNGDGAAVSEFGSIIVRQKLVF